MQGGNMIWTVHLAGTLGANQAGVLQLPFPATITHVIAVASNNSDATLALGTSAGGTQLMTAQVIGDSGTPVTFTRGTSGNVFNGASVTSGQFVPLAANTPYYWTLDYDGAGGTAAVDVDIAFVVTD